MMNSPDALRSSLIISLMGFVLLSLGGSAFSQICNSVAWLDDFEEFSLNRWGGVTGTFSSGGARCMPISAKGGMAYGNSGHSLGLEYQVLTKDSFAGYSTRLNNFDLSKYNYLSFVVKGGKGGEYCRLQLSDEIGEKTLRAKVPLWDYLPDGPDSTWKKVIIPLDAFYLLQTKNSIDELAIVFENVQSRFANAPLEGTLFIDNLVFGTFDPGYVKIDHFDDWASANALGGETAVFTEIDKDSAYSMQIIRDTQNISSNVLCVSYDKNGASTFGGIYFIFGDGFDGYFGNISNYEDLCFSARAVADTTNPESFAVQFVSLDTTTGSTFYPRYRIGGLTTTMQEYRCALTSFRESFKPYRYANLRSINTFNILFEDHAVVADKGKVIFDNIELRQEGYQGVDLLPPPTPVNLRMDGQPIISPVSLTDQSVIEFDLLGDLGRVESVSLIYRKKTGNIWYTLDQMFMEECAQPFKLRINPGFLPNNDKFYCRVIAENYNGQQSASSAFEVSANSRCPFFACDSLFMQGFQLYQFLRNEYGMYQDAARFNAVQFHPASVASIGMGLISLCIADTMGWIDDAEAEALLTLKAVFGAIPELTPARNNKGYFRHFINMKTGHREWDSEYSTIDTAILISGALFCKKYFRSDSIKYYADTLYLSIDWDSAIADVGNGTIYMTQDSIGRGNDITKPFNEYIIVAWLANISKDTEKNNRAIELWDLYYKSPTFLPKSTYEGISILTDSPNSFLSSFVVQFPYYLCHYFTVNKEYLQYFRNAMLVDKLWWRKNTQEPEYVWGLGAGASNVSSGYHADNILSHPATICSPQIIAGFIPAEPANIDDLKKIYFDSRGNYSLPNRDNTKIIWRFSTEAATWHANDVQSVDFSTMLFGLAAHPDALGPGFFSVLNNFDIPFPTAVTRKPITAKMEFTLWQNYPNPFNPETLIKFELSTNEQVKLSIVNIQGQEIITLINEQKAAGTHEVKWNGKDKAGDRVSSGVYLFKLQAGEAQCTKKLTLIQ